MNLKPIYIEATDIPDAWHQCIFALLDHGFRYEIQQGSFVGQTRLEFDFVTVYIKYPYKEPYNLMLPEIPAALGIPNPVAPGYVEQYLPYLMTDHKSPGESYTYGSRLTPQLSWLIELLKKTPKTNQAILQIAHPDDYKLADPPCMRHLDFRVKDKILICYPSFRSWDAWGGFPANLAGISVLQKYIASEIGIQSGPIIASSKGLHIYGYVEELARLRRGVIL